MVLGQQPTSTVASLGVAWSAARAYKAYTDSSRIRWSRLSVWICYTHKQRIRRRLGSLRSSLVTVLLRGSTPAYLRTLPSASFATSPARLAFHNTLWTGGRAYRGYYHTTHHPFMTTISFSPTPSILDISWLFCQTRAKAGHGFSTSHYLGLLVGHNCSTHPLNYQHIFLCLHTRTSTTASSLRLGDIYATTPTLPRYNTCTWEHSSVGCATTNVVASLPLGAFLSFLRVLWGNASLYISTV